MTKLLKIIGKVLENIASNMMMGDSKGRSVPILIRKTK